MTNMLTHQPESLWKAVKLSGFGDEMLADAHIMSHESDKKKKKKKKKEWKPIVEN